MKRLYRTIIALSIFAGCFLICAVPAHADGPWILFTLYITWVLSLVFWAISYFAEVLFFCLAGKLPPRQAFTASFWVNFMSAGVGYITYLVAVWLEVNSAKEIYHFILYLSPIVLLVLIIHAVRLRTYLLCVVGCLVLITGVALAGIHNGRDEYIFQHISYLLVAFSHTLAIEVWPARRYIEKKRIDITLLCANAASYWVMVILYVWIYSDTHFA